MIRGGSEVLDIFKKRIKRAACGFLERVYKWISACSQCPEGHPSSQARAGREGTTRALSILVAWKHSASLGPSLELAVLSLRRSRAARASVSQHVAVCLERGQEGRASSEDPAPAALCRGLLGISSLALMRLEDHLASGLRPAWQMSWATHSTAHASWSSVFPEGKWPSQGVREAVQGDRGMAQAATLVPQALLVRYTQVCSATSEGEKTSSPFPLESKSLGLMIFGWCTPGLYMTAPHRSGQMFHQINQLLQS